MPEIDRSPRRGRPSARPHSPATTPAALTLPAVVLLTVALLAVALTTAAPAVAGQVDTMPPAPVPLPDVHNVEFDGSKYQFTHPYLPPVSASKDYRVGLMRKIGSLTKARFVLYAPEKLGAEVLAPGATAGAAVILGVDPSGNVNKEIDISTLHDDSEYGTDAFIHHLALCDPNGQATDPPNPQVCAVVDEHGQTVDGDCYTLYAITATTLDPTHPDIEAKEIDEDITIDEPALRLWSRELLVKVVDPKTADAYIASVTPQGTAIEGGIILGGDPHGFTSFHTPMIVGPESRLLIARLGFKSDIVWSDGTSTRTDNHDIAYSYNASEDPCDLDGWTSFKPLAFAPEDAELKDLSNEPKYGIAAYPFRTASGAAIDSDPSGGVTDIAGRYIWVDQDADNIFFATLSRSLFDLSTSCQDGSGTCDHLYDVACVSGTDCSATCQPCNESLLPPGTYCSGCSAGQIGVDDASSSATAPHQGWTMMGLWTHGKMVLLDSMVNHTDFGLRGREQHHREVDLFSTGPDIRVGFGRDAAHLSPIVPGWIDTTVQFHSTENLFNMATQMKPRTPRDVVWQVTAGSRSDEIAFDDYVSHRTLIFSPMNALKELVPGDVTYYDGNAGTEMRLQNAATSLQLPTPAYGKVAVPSGSTDKGRIENVALGGVNARGFYLDPSTGIEYVIDDSKQQLEAGSEWILSLFYDRRVDPVGKVRRVFTFDDGSSNASIELHGITKVRVCGGSSPYACESATWPSYVAMPASGQSNWTHMAFHVIPDPTEQTSGVVRIYQDGFLFAEVTRPSDLDLTDDMTLRVGSPDGGTTLGVGGWIDELRVVQGPFSLEEICNHAAGTLVAVPYGYATMASGTERLADMLAPFVAASSNAYAVSGRNAVHREIHGHGQDAYSFHDYYVCNVDYTTPEGVSLHDPGDDEARSLRQRSVFPEGPVHWAEPRPSSTANQFCLGCHSDDEEMGLTLAPLAAGTVAASSASEPDRQPLQPPREVFGMIPSHFVADDKPAAAIAPPDPDTTGTLLDQWIDDGPLYRWTLEEVGGGHLENWGVGADHGDGWKGAAVWEQKGLTAGGGRGYVLLYDGGDTTQTSAYTGDTEVDLDDRSAISLSAWIQPYNGDVGSTPASQCTVSSPCTVIAKADPVAWSLEIYSTDPDESAGAPWEARLRVRPDGGSSVDELVVTLDDPSTPGVDFDPYAWHHILGIRADGALEIILDGDSQGTATASTALVESGTAKVRIGSSLDASDLPIHGFYGSIDDVRIYDRALTDAEVTELVTSTP